MENANLGPHIARNCKNNATKTIESAPHGRPNARVYNLNEGDIEAVLSKSVSGHLLVSNLNLFSLIDSGAKHSYIAMRVGDKLEGNRRTLSSPFVIVTPVGDVYN